MNENDYNNGMGMPQSIVSIIPDKNNEENQPPLDIEEENIPVIPLNGIIPFPEVPIPVHVDPKDVNNILINAESQHSAVFLCPKYPGTQGLELKDFFNYGICGRVLKIIELPDGDKTAFVLGTERAMLKAVWNTETGLKGKIELLPDKKNKNEELECRAAMELVEEKFNSFVKDFDEDEKNSPLSFAFRQQQSLIQKFYFVAMNSPISIEDKMLALSKNKLLERVLVVLSALDKTEQLFDLRRKIFEKTSFEISQQQKEHFLQSQIRLIREELGGVSEDNDVMMLQERAASKNWPEEMNGIFARELQKLTRFNVNSPDYAIQYSYLDTLLNLPWLNYVNVPIDLYHLQNYLHKDHFGLEKVKERIVEHMAVLKLKDDMRSPILCLVGPPGVGKTSLCKSIADSIGRDYARISLGGLHDEAEIRGHRKTYIGAMPGRILTALLKTHSSNPVFVLDEIDKIGKDYKGDPAQALLEVLDPEQNSRFHDNYLDVDYDLSKVFFIATANSVSTISTPLLDRMEIIDVSGYILEEKLEIARRHLIPKVLISHGFKKNEIKFTDNALKLIIDSYTRESGVRKLEKMLAKVIRKLAVKKAKMLKYPKTISEKLVRELLGREEIVRDNTIGDSQVGVATGLAWTAAGGEILYIESSLSEGKGNLTLTGNLGDVMKESATIAYQWVKSHADMFGLDSGIFASKDLHIHVPEGAVPKDGPSAGITIVTSIVSAFTSRKIKASLAMTGEITLRGKVLPVGGIKEKILAAKRSRITDIILSVDNKADIEEINPIYIEGLKFHFVERILEVLDIALLT